MIRKWLYKNGVEDAVEVEFHGIFQRSEAIEASPLIGGHKGGIIGRPVAVISHAGSIKEVDLNRMEYHDVPLKARSYGRNAPIDAIYAKINPTHTEIASAIIQEFKNHENNSR